jgi:complement component 1 Q subcomponent-binding protein
VQTTGPQVTLTRQTGSDKIVVKFNVTNTVNANESDQESDLNPIEQEQQSTTASPQLKSRPTFTVEINCGKQLLSFICSYLPNDYPHTREQTRGNENEQIQGDNQENFLEDFQIDEFTIHDGEWNETVYSSDCSVIDGELYDKLLNLLEEHGIGEGLFKLKDEIRKHLFCRSVILNDRDRREEEQNVNKINEARRIRRRIAV